MLKTQRFFFGLLQYTAIVLRPLTSTFDDKRGVVATSQIGGISLRFNQFEPTTAIHFAYKVSARFCNVKCLYRDISSLKKSHNRQFFREEIVC